MDVSIWRVVSVIVSFTPFSNNVKDDTTRMDRWQQIENPFKKLWDWQLREGQHGLILLLILNLIKLSGTDDLNHFPWQYTSPLPIISFLQDIYSFIRLRGMFCIQQLVFLNDLVIWWKCISMWYNYLSIHIILKWTAIGDQEKFKKDFETFRAQITNWGSHGSQEFLQKF